MALPIVSRLVGRPTVLATGLVAIVVLTLAGSVSAGPARTVLMTGDESSCPTRMIQATLRFTPGRITVGKSATP